MDEAAARAAFEEALRSYRPEFGSFFLARLFGLEVTYENDTCVVTVPVRDFMFNPQGWLHGGVISLVADISMGHLLQKTAGAGTTLEMKVQFLRAASVGELRAVGRFLKRGRSINYLESRIAQNGADVAAATSTWMLLTK